MGRAIATNTSSVIYVGSIPYDWTDEVVKSVVCGSGRIVDVRMGMDNPGKNKGFCFVEYSDPQESQQAIRLLTQIRLDGRKKLRVELSKEGLRTNGPTKSKPILKLDKSLLPSNVQLPPEMIYGAPTESNSQFNTFTPIQQPLAPQVPLLPDNLTQATKILPQPTSLPFVARDKISQTLSSIPPVQLVELISNLKNVLNSPNAARAADVFALSPQLASAAAQALLLMGFVDADVITESMKVTTQASVPSSTPTPLFSSATMNYQPAPVMNMTPDPRWPNLPAITGAKLAKLDPNEANIIAQVLVLPNDQVVNLPSEQRVMIEQLKAQYL